MRVGSSRVIELFQVGFVLCRFVQHQEVPERRSQLDQVTPHQGSLTYPLVATDVGGEGRHIFASLSTGLLGLLFQLHWTEWCRLNLS